MSQDADTIPKKLTLDQIPHVMSLPRLLDSLLETVDPAFLGETDIPWMYGSHESCQDPDRHYSEGRCVLVMLPGRRSGVHLVISDRTQALIQQLRESIHADASAFRQQIGDLLSGKTNPSLEEQPAPMGVHGDEVQP